MRLSDVWGDQVTLHPSGFHHNMAIHQIPYVRQLHRTFLWPLSSFGLIYFSIYSLLQLKNRIASPKQLVLAIRSEVLHTK